MKNIKTRKDKEKEFSNFFEKNPDKTLPKCTFFSREYRLIRPSDLIKREFYEFDEDGKRIGNAGCIGRIDVIFRYKGKKYAGEMKFQPFEGSDFWDALKIVGYAAYYEWQTETMGNIDYVKPAILMPSKRIKLEHKITARKMQLGLFGIEENGEDFRLMPLIL